MKKILHRALGSSLFAVLLFILVSQSPSFAYQHQILNEVLGDSTSSALPQLPPTAEGPGLILPDSPFFFLDQLKQNIRLALAFTPEAKAKIHAEIAGERLAELRFMLARNNKKGVTTDLQGISENLREAAKGVSQAQFAGRDVKKLAREINDNIKAKQKTLDVLENSASGAVKLEAGQAQEDIFESKIEVEDALPEDEIENEVRDDLARRIERKVENASASAKLLKRDLDKLNKQASQAATKSLKRREEALKEAIKKSDEQLRKVQEKLLENEKKKQEKLLEAEKKAAEQAQDALEKAQKAAIGLERARKVIEDIRRQPVTTSTTTQTGSGGGGSSGESSGGGEKSGSEKSGKD